MSPQALSERLNILFQQARWTEARQLLESYLADYPEDELARLYYINVLINSGEKKLARELIGPLLEESPDNPLVLRLAAVVELNDQKPKVAERLAGILIEQDPEDDDSYVLMARAKLDQRNYDAALTNLEYALDRNPENQEALNLKIYVGGFLGREDTQRAIDEALYLNPEDSTTIANHGYQLLRQGQVDAALERLRHALSINPTDQLARYAMLEAMRARFWPYRLYFKYQEAMAKLSGGASMGVIIGLWLAVNFLSRVAEENPGYGLFLWPVVYLCFALFLLTWIIEPIMNFYLLTNRYGRLLLDEDQKLMARLVGGSLGLAGLSLLAYFATGAFLFQALAFAFLLFTIPLGSFLRPIRKTQRTILTLYTVGLGVFGLGSIFLDSGTLGNIALFGLLAYQFVINGMMVREGGRTFGE
ncbi:tetratricopeptide repeat protein [Neolewinella lacunae]|uniref:Tetratricopeptide repeat protein n=1 Tax=Neolewinella lacunae TaxID=1517758 RepID=A0A923PKL6_9BACT|nr:tetratricopeptide repeat protein [Neolewinella lacunae]MBC6993421.1 tetratricopeptide repeat protein [Neolewinella lacunae]MDN3636303.1 tetratricopeptide repeat protein [Neolewinella lacunae]